jgi:uncharacterized protein (TIGR03435 family)
MIATDATLSALATMLGRQPELDGRVVIDKTRLTGKYDWTLEWNPLIMNSADTDVTLSFQSTQRSTRSKTRAI